MAKGRPNGPFHICQMNEGTGKKSDMDYSATSFHLLFRRGNA